MPAIKDDFKGHGRIEGVRILSGGVDDRRSYGINRSGSYGDL